MAWESETGIVAICPLTRIAYMPMQMRMDAIGGMRFIHAKCRWCDAHSRPRTDKEFDPSNPQIHTHILDQEKR